MPVVLSSKAYSVYPVSFHDLNFPFELPEDSLIINSCSNGIKTSQDLQNEKNQQNQQNQQSFPNQQDQATPSSLSTPEISSIVNGIASLYANDACKSLGIISTDDENEEEVKADNTMVNESSSSTKPIHDDQSIQNTDSTKKNSISKRPRRLPAKPVVKGDSTTSKSKGRGKKRSLKEDSKTTTNKSQSSSSKKQALSQSRSQSSSKSQSHPQPSSQSDSQSLPSSNTRSHTRSRLQQDSSVSLSHLLNSYNSLSSTITKDLEKMKSISSSLRKRQYSQSSTTSDSNTVDPNDFQTLYEMNDKNIKEVESFLQLLRDIKENTTPLLPKQVEKGGCMGMMLQPDDELPAYSVCCL